MKNKFDFLIVVEGKTDIDFLSSFIEAEFYSVNGSAVCEKDYDFINNCLKNREVVVLSDPDFPGLKIRNNINNQCPGVKNAFIRKEFSIKKNKVGVAESTKEEVLSALNNLLDYKNDKKGNLTSFDLYELGLIGSNNSLKLRKYLSEKLHLGQVNGKNLLKRLNSLGIDKEKIIGEIKNVK